jgi:DNA-binding IscR family transcriptional regulator
MVTNRSRDTFVLVVDALAIIAAAPEGIVTSERIAHELDINPVVVRRALAPMRAAGYVEARRGVGGGWAIARDPARLRLGDIFRALAPDRSASRSAVARIVARAEQEFIAELDRTNLADAMRG